jgi:prepilin-type N-terminal cleavage/methylation domain-containing protein/prepilin-type processing-associated H-X9-DG protein
MFASLLAGHGRQASRRHGHDPRRPATRTGFTLIELLVVVAIISLLMSILTPSLSHARKQAKSVVCGTRLHEFMNGLTAYYHEADMLPPSRYQVGADEYPRYHGWAEVLFKFLYYDNTELDQDFPVLRNHEDKRDYELWVCPDAQPRADSGGHYRVYELAWNTRSLDAELLKRGVPLIMDANPRVTDEYDLLRSDIPVEHIAGLEGEAYIDERHYGGANYAFFDGHVDRDTQLKEKLAEDWDLNPATENR